MVKPPTVRIIITIALTHKWVLRQVDVNNVFLHLELIEEVYMSRLLEFKQCDDPGILLVCRLSKGLYGLKQALRAWFERLKSFLINSINYFSS